jgi:hypothetical protein
MSPRRETPAAARVNFEREILTLQGLRSEPNGQKWASRTLAGNGRSGKHDFQTERVVVYSKKVRDAFS